MLGRSHVYIFETIYGKEIYAVLYNVFDKIVTRPSAFKRLLSDIALRLKQLKQSDKNHARKT